MAAAGAAVTHVRPGDLVINLQVYLKAGIITGFTRAPVKLGFWMDGKLLHTQLAETKPSGLVYFNLKKEKPAETFATVYVRQGELVDKLAETGTIELGTLNAIIGLSHLVKRRNTDAQQRDWLDKIIGAGNHLLSILNDILDYSKLEAGRIELLNAPFDPRALVDDVTDLFAVRAEEKGCLRYDLCRSVESPGTYVVVETYADQDALKVHSSTPYFLEFFGKMKQLLAPDGVALLHIDRHLQHDLGGGRSLKTLRERGLKVRRPSQTIGIPSGVDSSEALWMASSFGSSCDSITPCTPVTVTFLLNLTLSMMVSPVL